MKGMVFTELLTMADEMLGPDRVEAIIEESNLPSGGAYTAVGNYDHAEAVTLLTAFSKASGIPAADLLERFGEHLLTFFHQHYPGFFANGSDAFEFLESVESYIHVEVKKLYPDAELPRFVTVREEPDLLRFDYYSSRHLEYLAKGLIQGCLKYYGETGMIDQSEREDSTGPFVRFLIRRAPKAE